MERRRSSAQERAVASAAQEICVTSGAGSGKTRVLVDRFVRLVVDERVGVDAILAITFTEKAAAEMKERIARAFEEAGREEERRQVEFAYVSTIDSFCARLLREHALEARVDPRFRVLDEFESDRLCREAADAVLLEGPEEALFELVEATGIADLSLALRRLYERIRHSGMPLTPETLEPSLGPDRGPAILAQALTAVEGAGRSERLTARQKETALSLASLRQDVTRIPEDLPPAQLAELFKQLRSRFNLQGTSGQALFKEALERVGNGLDLCLAERLERIAGPMRRLLADLLAALDEEYARRKRSAGALDFADLEWRARDLLARSEEVRRRFRSRFRHLLLDESQDTNPLQSAILDLLRSGNSFFSVGDPKQSIYAFRDADVGILVGLQEKAREQGEAVTLPENFRSRKELVDFTNRLFASSLWREGPVPFTRMVAAARHTEKLVPSVEILRVEGESAEEARVREAAALAERIARIVEEGEIAMTLEGSEGLGKPLSYGDAAILFRSRTGMRIYERALAERHVPYFVQEGRGYFQTQEVRDLTNLLRIVDNPRDDYHLAAVLRSPLCSLTDDDLYRLTKGRQPRQRLVDRLEQDESLSADGRRSLAAFRSLFERIRSRKGQGPLWRVLDEVLSETLMAAHALLHFNGRRRFANLRKLVEMVRAWEERGEPSIPGLVEHLEDYSAEETRESEAMVDSPRDDTVKLMTIHAAKGLEFPLVAVADLGRSERVRAPLEIFRPGEGMGMAFYDPVKGERGLHPASYQLLKERQAELEKQEANRLLYVAVTRAREHLLLSGWSSTVARGGDSWMKSILEAVGGEAALRGDPTLRLLQEESPARGEGQRVSPAVAHREELLRGAALAENKIAAEDAALAGKVLSRASLSSPAVDASPFLATVTEIVQHRTCPRRYHLRYRIGAPSAEAGAALRHRDEEEAWELKDDELPAEALGDRVHRILAEEAGSPWIESLLAELAGKDRGEALAQVETFRRSELGRQAREGEAAREVPFAMGRFGATLRGQIDLIVTDATGALTLVDYKTSRLSRGEVAERAADFELQLRIYALAARDLFHRLPARACLHYLHPDVVVEVDVSAPALASAERAIEAFFEAHRDSSFPQNPARHCFSCGFLRAYCANLDRSALEAAPAPARP